MTGSRTEVRGSIALCASVLLALVVGSAPGFLSLEPEPERFQATIFKEPFLSLIAVAIAWLISTLRNSPARAEECRFLVSLPLSSDTVADRLSLSDLSRSVWVLAMTPAVFLFLFAVAPLPYLCRLFVMTAMLWLLAVLGNLVLQLLVSVSSRRHQSYPVRYVSPWVAATLLAYILCQIAMLAWPALISGPRFFGLLLSCLGAIALCLISIRLLFRKWLAAGLQFAVEWSGEPGRATRPGVIEPASLFFSYVSAGHGNDGPRALSPMLTQSLTRTWRELRPASTLSVTLLFCFGYLLASNNADLEIRSLVLIALFALFSLLHCYRAIASLSIESQSPKLLHTLPLSTGDVFLATMIPNLIGPLLCAVAYTMLLLASGSGVGVAARFGISASVISVCLVGVATNFAVGGYPRHQRAQRRFLLWSSGLVLCGTIAGPRIHWVILAWLTGSLLALRDTRMYSRPEASEPHSAEGNSGTMTETLLNADQIAVGYGDTLIIRNLSLEIGRGEFVGLIGANGAGKTTLLLALSGQCEPRRGTVSIRGDDAYAHNLSCKKRLGFVHEDPFFYSHLSAEEFLYFVARVRQMEASAARLRIESLIETLHLTRHRNKPTSMLSMGMRKKLALAAGILNEPELLFLDEALNGVDLESAFAIKVMLEEFVAAGGTVILSTHVLEVVERLADRYVLMKDGDIISDQSTANLARESGDANLEDQILRMLKGQ